MGAIKQRGRIWWIRYYRGGRRYEESTHSAKRGDALQGKMAIGTGSAVSSIALTCKNTDR